MTTGLRTAVAVHLSACPLTLFIQRLRDCGPRWQFTLTFCIQRLQDCGLRTTVAVHFNILHSTTTGLRTAVAVHFSACPLTYFPLFT